MDNSCDCEFACDGARKTGRVKWYSQLGIQLNNMQL